MKAGWQSVPLGRLLRRTDRFENRDDLREYQFAGTYSFARGIFRGARKLGSSFGLPKVQTLRGGDFVYCKIMAWEGAFGLVPAELDGSVLSGAFVAYEIDKTLLEPAFLDYYFKVPAHWQEVGRQSTGTNVRRQSLHPEKFEAAQLLLPPLNEQRSIVARIEAISGRIEEAKRLRGEAAVEAEAILSSGIDAIVGDTWPEKALATVCDAERPITYGIVQAGEHIPNGVPYIRVSDMAKPVLSPIGMLRTSSDIAVRYQRSAVRHGDIVFAIRATIGKMRVVPESLDGANLTQGTARIAAGTDAMTEYLYWVLQGRRVADRIQAATKGSTFREITLGRLRNIIVPAPPLDAQSDVIARCRNLADSVSRLSTTQADAAMPIGALMPAILDKAFRGNM